MDALATRKKQVDVLATSNASKLPIVYDTFTGVDGTPITGHIPDVRPPGASWVNFTYAGTVLSSNRAGAPVAAYGACLINSGVSDGTIEFDPFPVFAFGLELGVIFRSVDFSNFWRAILYFNGSSTHNEIAIIEQTAGVGYVRASAGILSSSPGKANLTLSGSNIVFSCDGVTISYASAVRSGITTHGLWLYGSTVQRIDNFSISL